MPGRLSVYAGQERFRGQQGGVTPRLFPFSYRISSLCCVSSPEPAAVPLAADALADARRRRADRARQMADVLRQQQGNAVKAAKILGISRQMLQKKIKAYGLRE